MRDQLMARIVMTLGVVMVSVPLFAHHGNAAYDTATPITVKGTVTEWIWANPHSFLKFDVKDDGGKVMHWVAEASTPSDLVRNGVTKTTFKIGEDVTVSLLVAKNGLTVGRLRQITLANGEVYQMGGGAAPAAPAATAPAAR